MPVTQRGCLEQRLFLSSLWRDEQSCWDGAAVLRPTSSARRPRDGTGGLESAMLERVGALSSAEGRSHPSIRAAARSDSHRCRERRVAGAAAAGGGAGAAFACRVRFCVQGPLGRAGPTDGDMSGRSPRGRTGFGSARSGGAFPLRTAGPRARRRRHGRERHRAVAAASLELWLMRFALPGGCGCTAGSGQVSRWAGL